MHLQPLPKPRNLASKSPPQKERVDGKIPVSSACGARSVTSVFHIPVPVNFTPEVKVGCRVKSAQLLGAFLARAMLRTPPTESQKVELLHPGVDGKNARHRKNTQCMAKPSRLGVEVRQAQW